MRSEKVIQKILELIDWTTAEIAATEDRREKGDLISCNRVFMSVAHKLGYRTRKANTDRPTSNPFQDAVKNMEDKPIEQIQIIDNKEQLNRMFVITDEVKEKLKKQRDKFTRTNDKQKSEVIHLYKAKNTVQEISEKLWISEESINKILGIENNDNKVLLADSSNV